MSLLEKANGGTRFTATLSFGVAAPWIGRIADRVLARVFANRFAAVQEHMREEGRNSKYLLDRGATGWSLKIVSPLSSLPVVTF
jgi:hypothetical protein